jgi:Zn-finger nucleic acid-binding protein
MACPTCDHTMHHVGEGDISIFHCPRCGTLVTDRETETAVNRFVQAPMLVERCREYEATQIGGTDGTYWEGLGIAEAIAKQEDRR